MSSDPHGTGSPAPLTAAQVAHVARLAKLEVAPEAVERYRGQLAAVLAHIARIDALDVSGAEPMAHPFESHNRLDDDVPEAHLPIEAVLMNAPAVEGRFLAVPKVLAEES
jgi:aspartyl-tRNA(Asn)/glutamyl-tRNA(Gln) amidotransferase subunit C